MMPRFATPRATVSPALLRIPQTLAIGTALIALTICLAAYARAVTSQPSWETEFMLAVQDWTPAPLEALARLMTVLGHSPAYPVTVAVSAALLALWFRRPSLAMLVFSAAILRGASPIMKAIIERERPSPLAVTVTERLTDPSFPSGHVFGATLLYGALIYAAEVAIPHHAWKRACQATLASLIFLMGFARVQQGAHWPTDVLAGWSVGADAVLMLVHLHRGLSILLTPRPQSR